VGEGTDPHENQQSQKDSSNQPSYHRNVNDVKTGQDATRNAQVVRVIDKLQHGAARREQVRERRASDPRGRTFKQDMELIPKGALGAVRAQPRRAGGAALTVIARNDKGQVLVAAQPKVKDAKDA
jgi:hypothetical protein